MQVVSNPTYALRTDPSLSLYSPLNFRRLIALPELPIPSGLCASRYHSLTHTS